MNSAVIEQCSTTSIIYMNKFDPNKMPCLNQMWKHVFIFLEYSCNKNILTRTWTININVKRNSDWPQQIFILTGTEYTPFDTTSKKDDLTIEQKFGVFDSNHDQSTTYMWTTLSNGPQCRIKYTIIKDICTPNKGDIGGKFTDFLCYYGKQNFDLKIIEQRQIFDKLLDESIKVASNTPQNNPSNSNNKTNSQTNSNPIVLDPHLISALNANHNLFWMKNKHYIIIAGIVVVVIILIIIILIIMRHNQSSDGRMSDDSSID